MSQPKSLNIFLSYGRDLYAPIVERLHNDLQKRGHKPFMDRDGMRGGEDWQGRLYEAIAGCDMMIAFISAHAMRPDGVCLDEIALARSSGKGILSLRLEACKPPLLISRTQWIDLRIALKDGVPTADEAMYKKALAIVDDIAAGDIHLALKSPDDVMEQALTPVRFDYESWLVSKTAGFVGRQWLMDEVMNALRDGARKLLCVTGIAGSGKSAFLAKLCLEYPRNAAGFFVFRFDDAALRSAVYALRSLAYQLSRQFDEYLSQLSSLPDIRDLCGIREPAALFRILFIELAGRVTPPSEPVALMVDAMDELPPDEARAFLRALASGLPQAPAWLRFVVTMRPEQGLLDAVRPGAQIFAIDDEQGGNRDDCLQYLRDGLDALGIQYSAETLALAMTNSQCNFQYLGFWLEELARSRPAALDPDAVPGSLCAVYDSFMDRCYAGGMAAFRDQVRPMLEIICAAHRPLSRDDARQLLGVNKYTLNATLQAMGKLLLPTNDRTIALYHRTLRQYFTDDSRTFDYYVDPDAGGERILACLRANNTAAAFTALDRKGYLYTRGFDHLLDAKDGDTIISLLHGEDLRVLERLAVAIAGRGEADAADALAWLGEVVDAEMWLHAAARAMDMMIAQGEDDKARAAAAQASRHLARGTPYIALCARYITSYGIEDRNQANDGIQALQEVADAAQALPDRDGAAYLQAACFVSVGHYHRYNDRFDAAMAAYERAARACEGCLRTNDTHSRRRQLSIASFYIGDEAKRAGNLTLAGEYYAKALAIDADMAARFPSLTTRRDVAISNERMGVIADRNDDMALAEAYFTASVNIKEELARAYPSLRTKLDLSIGYDRMGCVAMKNSNPAGAAAWYKKMHGIRLELAARFPSLSLKRWLASSFHRMGDAAYLMPEGLDLAEDYYNKALAMRRELAAREKREGRKPSLTTLRDVALSCAGKGEIAWARFELAEGIAWYRKALAVEQRLAARYPSMDRSRHMAACHMRIGGMAALSEDNALAGAHYQQAMGILEELAAQERQANGALLPETRRALADCHAGLGSVNALNLHPRQAWDHYKMSMLLLRELTGHFPAVGDLFHLASAYMTLGTATKHMGYAQSARQYFKEALAIAKTLPTDNRKYAVERMIRHLERLLAEG